VHQEAEVDVEMQPLPACAVAHNRGSGATSGTGDCELADKQDIHKVGGILVWITVSNPAAALSTVLL
jgi:hypothetical protein